VRLETDGEALVASVSDSAPPFNPLDLPAAAGRLLWDFDTVWSYETVNGVPATGGSLDGPGPVVVAGRVFVSSGYPRFGGTPGNVLLAFGVAGDGR